ncbi:MAG TPA: carbohydrate-binding family 9-like protein [Fimbriimonadaceae bacterium]|nr:carbohydrate-binding family 9-like protein [Fimbriimonadaceae bacterium]
MPLSYTCRYTHSEPEIDGNLEKVVWNIADWTSDFVDIEGDLKPDPRFKTRAKMLWDDKFFYVGAELKEPHLWATLTEHDSVIFQDNDFEVFIDPDGDAARYFEFEINALNTTWDLYLPRAYRDGGSADNSWETYAKTAVELRGTLNDPSDIDQGWSVEIAFPWECFANGGMPTPPSPGDVWRVNFSRVQWHLDIVDGRYRKRPGLPEDNWVWSPQGVIDMHQPEHWGFVVFAE